MSSPQVLRHPRVWPDALLRRLLALSDLFAVLLASVSLNVLGYAPLPGLATAALSPLWLVIAKVIGLYDRDQRALRHLTVDEAPKLLVWALTGTAVTTLLLRALSRTLALTSPQAIRLYLVAVASALVLRGLARALWRRLTPGERTLIVGKGTLADATRRKIELFADIHVDLIEETPYESVEALVEDLDRLSDVDRVILGAHTSDGELMRRLIAHCRRERVKLSVIPPAGGVFGTAVQLSHIADLPIVEYNTWDTSRSTMFLKRVLDVTLSSVALVALLPVFVVVALAIVLDSRGPILFTQSRGGLSGVPFRMIKFRTMVADAEQLLPEVISLDDLRDPMFKLPNDPRVTRVGRFLRRTSLDEIPQLVNVLKGDMSLVGPRPEQVELVDRYTSEHWFRLSVKPGMTGPMQVFGRGNLSFEERLAVEREYVENMSIARDLRIIALTVTPLLSGRGAF
ncbi:MAG: sugar transferase [Gaiellaceae bacterium]